MRTVLARVRDSPTETGEPPSLEILAIGQAESGDSVRYGEVVRQREVIQAVRDAVAEIERAAGVEVGSALVSVGSRTLRSINSWGTFSVPGPRRRIGESDAYRAVMAAVPRDGGPAWLRPPYELLHALPQEFRVDDGDATDDPVGWTGEKIACRVHLVSCPGAGLRGLEETVNGAGIRSERLLAAPLAAGYGVLDPADRREGVIVLDIGAMTTAIAVFRRGVLWHSDLMQSGGRACTRDLAAVLGTSFVHAERAKVSGGGHPMRCPPELLADVLRRRAERDLTEVRDRLRRGLGDLPGTVVLTGGGANLGGLSDVARRVFGGDVEIRGPRELVGHRDLPSRLPFATAVGLCRYGASLRRRRPRSAAWA
ncbi:MAG: cell division protein FtsA [Acidobacteria bacterium]|nr:cell division protein FtsA [Acidobacteriota bacterium]MYG74644.1 cell division protein FtsA [Acidobacteriota bacterium]